MAAKGPRDAAPGRPPEATASTLGAPAAGIARSTIIEGSPRITVTLPGAQPASTSGFALAPDKLGGPKPAANGTSSKTKPAVYNPADFLHAAHASACRIFGTTLGPEANAAHRNHLHVDMAERKSTRICE